MAAISKTITKAQLAEAIRLAEANDYNRQVQPEILGAAKRTGHRLTLVMIHRYKHGEACEPHVRCMVDANLDGGIDTTGLTIDLPIDFWNRLPGPKLTAEYIEREGRRVEAMERTRAAVYHIGAARGDSLEKINRAIADHIADVLRAVG